MGALVGGLGAQAASSARATPPPRRRRAARRVSGLNRMPRSVAN